jgi:hypothetical protein
MLSNVGGLSAGNFKVPIFMDMLNYTVTMATTLVYPVTAGAGLANLIQIIPKRNPIKDTSLIDYHIVKILIPSSIYGSTLGVIILQLIPEIAQDLILMTVFSFFTYWFLKQYFQHPN